MADVTVAADIDTLLKSATAAAARGNLSAAKSGANTDITSLSTIDMAAAFRPKVVTLTDAESIATNAALGNRFDVVLADSRTMASPTNPVDGQKILYKIKQGGTGSYTITWQSGEDGFAFTTGTPAPTLSTAVGKYDLVGFCYNGSTFTWDCLGYTIGLG